MSRQTHVNILMGTHNGAAFLAEQLQSFNAQTYPDWSLWVSDDGSTDATLAILRRFQQDNPDRKITILTGPCKGHASNFLALLHNRDIVPGYVAFADQDDVWLPQKLARAVRMIRTSPQRGPVVYGSRTIITDANLAPRRLSPRFDKPPGFRNALVQNILGGNTQVLNREAVALVRRTANTPNISYHDWWLYQLVTGCGGMAIYDPEPTLLYRQHGKNIIGSNLGLAAIGARVALLIHGRFKRWNDENVAALLQVEHLLTPQNQRILAGFRKSRRKRWPSAWVELWLHGLYRQKKGGSISLYLAAALGRM